MNGARFNPNNAKVLLAVSDTFIQPVQAYVDYIALFTEYNAVFGDGTINLTTGKPITFLLDDLLIQHVSYLSSDTDLAIPAIIRMGGQNVFDTAKIDAFLTAFRSAIGTGFEVGELHMAGPNVGAPTGGLARTQSFTMDISALDAGSVGANYVGLNDPGPIVRCQMYLDSARSPLDTSAAAAGTVGFNLTLGDGATQADIATAIANIWGGLTNVTGHSQGTATAADNIVTVTGVAAPYDYSFSDGTSVVVYSVTQAGSAGNSDLNTLILRGWHGDISDGLGGTATF